MRWSLAVFRCRWVTPRRVVGAAGVEDYEASSGWVTMEMWKRVMGRWGVGSKTEAGCRGRGGCGRRPGWRSLGVGGAGAGGRPSFLPHRWPGAGRGSPVSLGQGARAARPAPWGFLEHHPVTERRSVPREARMGPSLRAGACRTRTASTPFPLPSKINPAPSEGRESIQGQAVPC